MSKLSARVRPTGSLVVIVVCLGWGCVLALLALRYGYVPAAAVVGVPAQQSPFGDMRVVLDAIEAAGNGSQDYFLTHVYYHRAWLAFSHLGLRGSDTAVVASILGLAMLSHFAVLAWQNGNRARVGLVFAGFACSPPVMLALERGNTDLLLYCLLAAACHLLARRFPALQVLGTVLIFVAGVLKFFPFAGGLAILSGERPRGRLILLLLFGLATGLFLVLGREEVNRVIHLQYLEGGGDNPHIWASFGAEVSANTFDQKFTRLTGVALPRYLPGMLRWSGVFIMSLVAARKAAAIRREPSSTHHAEGVTATGFAAGAGIFVASFILVRSYNYKFIFVALALPALCEWARSDDNRGRTARVALAGLLAWAWSALNGYAYVLMNTFAVWVVVGCFAALLMAWLSEQAGLRATAWGRTPVSRS